MTAGEKATPLIEEMPGVPPKCPAHGGNSTLGSFA